MAATERRIHRRVGRGHRNAGKRLTGWGARMAEPTGQRSWEQLWTQQEAKRRLIAGLPLSPRGKRLLMALDALHATYDGVREGGIARVDPPRDAIAVEMDRSVETFKSARRECEAIGVLRRVEVSGRTSFYETDWSAIVDLSRPSATGGEPGRRSRRATDTRVKYPGRVPGSSTRVEYPGTNSRSPLRGFSSYEENQYPDRTGTGSGQGAGVRAGPGRDEWIVPDELQDLASQELEPLPVNSLGGGVFRPIQTQHLSNPRDMLEWHRRQLSASCPVAGPTAAHAAFVVAAALRAARMPAAEVRRSRVAVFSGIVRKGFESWGVCRQYAAEAIQHVRGHLASLVGAGAPVHQGPGAGDGSPASAAGGH